MKKCDKCKTRPATNDHQCPFSELVLKEKETCNCCRRCELECIEETKETGPTE